MLLSETARSFRYQRPSWKDFLAQLHFIGVKSQSVVITTGAATGMVLCAQTYLQFHKVKMDTATGAVVSIGMSSELGPVLAALMLTARVGAAMTAELGTMKVTEQIDALVTLSTNPMKYLTVPRVLAGTLTVPLLVAVGDLIGIMGGFLVATGQLGFNKATYIQTTLDFLESADVISSLAKGAVFGFIATLIGCYHGMASGRGAMGVGGATKTAVAAASILILAANFLLTSVMFTP
jgi:phospholipid/cholesterol/gamma-HCH transport system permease protein